MSALATLAEVSPVAIAPKAAATRSENGNGATAASDADEEFNHVIMGLAMAKITIAEMEDEKIK